MRSNLHSLAQQVKDWPVVTFPHYSTNVTNCARVSRCPPFVFVCGQLVSKWERKKLSPLSFSPSLTDQWSILHTLCALSQSLFAFLFFISFYSFYLHVSITLSRSHFLTAIGLHRYGREIMFEHIVSGCANCEHNPSGTVVYITMQLLLWLLLLLCLVRARKIAKMKGWYMEVRMSNIFVERERFSRCDEVLWFSFAALTISQFPTLVM